MFFKYRRWFLSFFMIALAALACNLPGGQPTEEPTATFTPTPGSASPTPTATATAEQACTPTVTTTTLANVRNGPGQVYAILGNLPQGASATVAGKSQDSAWWYIQFAGGENGFAWISTTVTTSTCIPTTLAIIAAPPAPQAPADADTEEAANDPAASATPTKFIIFIPPGGFQLIPTATPTKFIIFIPPGGFQIIPSATPTP